MTHKFDFLFSLMLPMLLYSLGGLPWTQTAFYLGYVEAAIDVPKFVIQEGHYQLLTPKHTENCSRAGVR